MLFSFASLLWLKRQCRRFRACIHIQSEINEDIQGRPGERDPPKNQVSPYVRMYTCVHTPPPPQSSSVPWPWRAGRGRLLTQREGGGRRPHTGTSVCPPLSHGNLLADIHSYPTAKIPVRVLQILQIHQYPIMDILLVSMLL